MTSIADQMREAFGEPPRKRDTTAPTLPRATSTADTPYGMSAARDECAQLALIPPGARDHEINRSAYRLGRLIGGGQLTYETALSMLWEAARATRQPDWEISRALRDDVTGGLAAGQKEPRYPTPKPLTNGNGNGNGHLPDMPDLPPFLAAPPAAPAPLPDLDQEEFWNARPELDHIRTYARARRACPWAVLGVVLARVVVATPRWVVLPPLVGAEASLNMFVALVAASGGGKGASESCAAEAVNVGHIDTAGVGSGEGINHLFMRREKTEVVQHREAVLMRVSEIDTLGALGARNGATLLPALRQAWSGEDLGFSYADPTKALPVPAHSYRLCLSAGVQPGRAQWVLDDADGGTPQRFLWLPAVDPDAPDIPPDCPQPIRWTAPRWPVANAFTERSSLPVCEAARQVIDINRLHRLRGEGTALDGHALLARLKAAAALGILNGHAEVTDEDWELSNHIATLSEKTRQSILDHLRAEATVKNQKAAEAEATRAITVSARQEEERMQKACRTVMSKISATGEAGCLRRDLLQALTPSRRPYLDAVLDQLSQAGLIGPHGTETRRWISLTSGPGTPSKSID